MGTAARLTLNIAVTLTLLLAVLSVPAQTQDQRVPAIRTTTRLVQLNVVVLDNHKRPVSDLSQSDFEVFDNGLEQKLSHFSVSSTEPPNARSMPSPLVITNRPEQPGEGSRTATVILVDELLLQPNIYGQDASEAAKAPIKSARLAVLKFLATLQPGEEVALFALRLEGVVVIHDLTDDSAELIAAAQTIGTGLLKGRMRLPSGEPLALRTTKGPARSGHDSGSEDWHRVLVGQAFQAIAHHLQDTARKNVVWISSSFPSVTNGLDPALMAAERDAINPIPRAMLPVPQFADTQSHYNQLRDFARQLSSANISVYPIDPQGLLEPLTLIGGGAERKSSAGPPPPVLPTVSQFAIGPWSGMDLVASETGGRAFYGANGLDKQLREIVDEGRVSYLLGYYPGDSAWDGKYHHVEVKLKRPGLSVLCRKGYFAADEPLTKNPDTVLRDAAKGMLEWSGIGVTLNVSSNPLEWLDQEMVVKLDTQEIHFENKDGRWRAQLDMVFAQLAKDGRILESVKDQLDLALLPESYDNAATQGWFYSRTVDVNPKAEKLRVVVRDRATGAVGSVSVPVYQPKGVKSATHAKGPD